MEAGANIVQADAAWLKQIAFWGYAWAIIFYFELEQAVEALGFYIDVTLRCSRRDRVLDRVFHDRLQNEMRNLCGKRHRFHFKCHFQSISETDLLDVKIGA